MTARQSAFRFTLCLLVAVIAGCTGGGIGNGTPPIVGRPSLSNAQTNLGPTRVVYWNQVELQSIRTHHLGPTIVARALAIVQTAVYDAWATYDSHAIPVFSKIPKRERRECSPANINEAISFAAYRTLLDLFPTDAGSFSAAMTQLGYDPNDTSTDPTKPDGIGNSAAAAVLEFRHHDGANQLGDLHPGAYTDYTSYAPVNTPYKINDPNRWQPLLIPNGNGTHSEQVYLTPFWGLVKPFALSSGSELRPQGPDLYPSNAYLEEARQVLDYSADLTDLTKVIAEYWRDGPNSETPPGHWCLFAQYVSNRDHHDTGDDVKMFFALSNALLDASIAAWDAKRAYDSVRPITAIHFLFSGRQVRAWAGPYQGTREIDGSRWIPYQPANVVTPPFPEYVSGHSAFSEAGAEILRRFTHSDYFGDSAIFLAGSSTIEPGSVPASTITLSWATFSDAAVQAGLSRRYGGIHFVDGDLRGRAIGKAVGKLVWRKAESLFEGRDL